MQDALRLGAVGFDAVKHLLLCRIEGRPNRLDLDFYPHLPQISVKTTRAGDYLTLLSGRAAGATSPRCFWSTISRSSSCPPSWLPTFLREYGKLAAQCAAEGVSHPDYLLRLAEVELTDRHQRMVQRRIRAARFPATKGLDTFDFSAIPSVNQPLVTQLARCEYVEHHENVIAIGNSGTGKTHVALGLGLAAGQRGLSVGFTTAAALVNELMEARDERRLLNLQRQLARLQLLIIDELGFVPLSHTGAELLFEVFSQRYERGSILVTTNLPFDEWTEVFRVRKAHRRAAGPSHPHHVHILEMNGESYRLKGQPAKRRRAIVSAGSGGCRLASRRYPSRPRRQGGGPHPTVQAGAVRHHPGGTVLLRPSGMFSLRP